MGQPQIGRCRKAMWWGDGSPAGVCSREAYGPPTWDSEWRYAFSLACPRSRWTHCATSSRPPRGDPLGRIATVRRCIQQSATAALRMAINNQGHSILQHDDGRPVTNAELMLEAVAALAQRQEVIPCAHAGPDGRCQGWEADRESGGA